MLQLIGPEDLPAPPEEAAALRAWADRAPEADARLKAARPVIEERASSLGMPTENLLTPELLRRLAWEPPVPADADHIAAALAAGGARRWQIAQTAQLIAEAFVVSAQNPAEPAEPAS